MLRVTVVVFFVAGMRRDAFLSLLSVDDVELLCWVSLPVQVGSIGNVNHRRKSGVLQLRMRGSVLRQKC